VRVCVWVIEKMMYIYLCHMYLLQLTRLPIEDFVTHCTVHMRS